MDDSKITKREVQQRIEGLPEEVQKRMICALVGHSGVVTTCFGYVNCARCGVQVGDTLGGTASLDTRVVVGHNCDTCRANFAKMNWRDKLLTPDPFAEE